MALASKWNGKCKDCGTEHKAGDMVDTNGIKGTDGKDHWCKMGKNCQGAMTLTNSDLKIIPREPTTIELRERFNLLEKEGKITPASTWGIIQEYIEVKEKCGLLGITHPATIGMILNNKVRDRQ